MIKATVRIYYKNRKSTKPNINGFQKFYKATKKLFKDHVFISTKFFQKK